MWPCECMCAYIYAHTHTLSPLGLLVDSQPPWSLHQSSWTSWSFQWSSLTGASLTETHTRGSQATHLACWWVQPDVCWCSYSSCHCGCWMHGHMGHSDLWSMSRSFICCTLEPICTYVYTAVETTPARRVRNTIYWEVRTDCADQVQDMARQAHQPATSLTVTSCFYLLIPLFSHTHSSPNHLDPCLPLPLVPPLNIS